MMKRLGSLFLVLFLLGSLLCGCGSSDKSGDTTTAPPADDTVHTLIVQSHDPEDSAPGRLLADWAAGIEEESEGQLKFDIYNGGVLGSGRDTVPMILNGTCDIGWGGQSSFPDEFPASEIITLPMLGITSATIGSHVFWDLYNEFDSIRQEYTKYKVLLVHTNCPNGISTKDFQIKSADDISGMNLRVNAGPISNFFEKLGAAPVSIGMGEVFQAIDNNTIDGITTDWHGIYSFSLYEILNEYLDLNIIVGNQFLLMNLDKYNALPDDLKAVIDAHSGDYLAENVGSYWDDVEAKCRDTIKESGGDIYKLSDAEQAKIQAVADEVAREWIASAKEKGLPGQEMYDATKKLIAQYS
jgi:TRAP-type C4-dicarboxylate transport system substrate-binding protein